MRLPDRIGAVFECLAASIASMELVHVCTAAVRRIVVLHRANDHLIESPRGERHTHLVTALSVFQHPMRIA
jgi:hypothetical protein